MRMTFTCGALLCLAGPSALAQSAKADTAAATPAATLGDRASGHCEMVRGTSAAEAALQFAPELFGTFGVVNTGEAEGGAGNVPLGEPKLRVTAGVSYDLVGLYRGSAMRRRAEAECRRFQALSALRAAVRHGGHLGEETALKARAQVLAAAMPRAEALVNTLRQELRDGRATLDELNAVQLRLDGLRALATETGRGLERAASLPPPPDGRSLRALMDQLQAADDDVEALSGGLRRASAWRLNLRGGYDEIFDVDQDVPLFGQVTLSYNLGHLWQGSANERAREGRRRATRDEVGGAPEGIRELMAELQSLRRTETARLAEVDMLVTDLEGQLRQVEALQTQQVRRFHDYLQLELARLRAEQAYLRVHVETLGGFLEATPP